MRFQINNPQDEREFIPSGGGPDEGAHRSGRHSHRHGPHGHGPHGHGPHGHGPHADELGDAPRGPGRGSRAFGGRGGRGGPSDIPRGFGRGGDFGFGRGDFPGGPGGPFGGHGGPGGPGHHGRGRRRRGDVRTALLLLLAEEPRNGYGLMQTIEERSGGRWRPSPGSVYPALAQLEDEGFVRAIESDAGRVFEITDAGREHLGTRGDATPPWESGDTPRARAFHEMRTLMFGIGKAYLQVLQVAEEPQWARAREILEEARRSLYGILAESPQGTPEAPDAPEAGEGTDVEDEG